MGRIVPILWFCVPWPLALLLAIEKRAALRRSRRLQAILVGLVTLPFLLPIAFVTFLFLYGSGVQRGLLPPLVTTHYFTNGETILAQDSRYVLVERLGLEEGWVGFAGDGVVFGTIELRRRDGSGFPVRLADYLPADA
jgi:hypothetical protein